MDRIIKKAGELLFPLKCIMCGEVIGGSVPLCSGCKSVFARLVSEPCPVCHSVREECTCLHKKKDVFLFYYYSEQSKKLISCVKHVGITENLSFLAGLLAFKLRAGELPQIIAYPERLLKNRRKYGFDQSEMLALSLAKELGIDSVVTIKRKKQSAEQKLLSSYQRKVNMQNVFYVECPEKIQNKRVLIVDDVMTTGATVTACSCVLKKYGAKSVLAAVLARTPLSKHIKIRKSISKSRDLT